MNCRQLSSFNGQALDSVSGDIELSNKIRGSTFESEASGGHRDKRIRRLAGFVESRRDQLSRLKPDADLCRWILRNEKSFELSKIFIARQSFSCLDRNFCGLTQERFVSGWIWFTRGSLDTPFVCVDLRNRIIRT